MSRAFYKKNTQITILDEPTSALDPLSEFEFYKKSNELLQTKNKDVKGISVFISHRLASYQFCDKVAVFDNGKIIQYGSHLELLKATGLKYQKLWEIQAQYYRN